MARHPFFEKMWDICDNEGNYTKESILQELKYYATIFQAFVYGNERYTDSIRKSLRALRLLKQTTCYPFLFHVFHDFEQKVISEATLEKTLKLILAYLIRRSVCGVPTSSLRGMFTYLYNRVFKVETNKKKYYESINKFLHTVSSKDQFPSDSEFYRNLQTAKEFTAGFFRQKNQKIEIISKNNKNTSYFQNYWSILWQNFLPSRKNFL